MANLTISDVTWDGFTASWSPAGGDFDSFVIEVTNMENVEESQNLTLSGGALSLGISGLNPNTSYMVGLYGMYRDSVQEPLYIEATTGTCSRLALEPFSLSSSPPAALLLSSSSGVSTPDLQCLSACSKSARARASVSAATSLPAGPATGTLGRPVSALQPLSASQLREGARC